MFRSKRKFTSGILTEQLALKLDSELGYVKQVLDETLPKKGYEKALHSFIIHEDPSLNYISALKETAKERIRVTVPVYSSRKSYVQTKPITHSAENENGNETSDELVFFQHSIPAYVQLTNNHGTILCALILCKGMLHFDSISFQSPQNSQAFSSDLRLILQKSQKYTGRKTKHVPASIKSSLLEFLDEQGITVKFMKALISRSWRKENVSYKHWIHNIIGFILPSESSTTKKSDSQ
ncbi:Mam33 family protein [Schizosaccharomyces pombe]